MLNIPLCAPCMAQPGVPNPGNRMSRTHLPFFSALERTVSILLKSKRPSSGSTSAHDVRKVAPEVFGLV
jgi:hypothetical protein